MKHKAILSILFTIILSFISNYSSLAQYADKAPLIQAVLNNTSEVEKVLAEGADINQQDEKGYTALIWACMASSDEKSREIAKFLIDHNANVNAKNVRDQTPLSLAEKAKYTKMINLLKSHGAK